MSIFGWSLPPGCGLLPGEEDQVCMLCGHEAGDCKCVECPVCGVQGDLRCYEEFGHMEMTEEQKARKAEVEKQWEEENRRTYEAEVKAWEEEQAWLNDEASKGLDYPSSK